MISEDQTSIDNALKIVITSIESLSNNLERTEEVVGRLMLQLVIMRAEIKEIQEYIDLTMGYKKTWLKSIQKWLCAWFAPKA